MINKRLSSKDWELISSYLDGELNPREKARLEERFNSRPEYKEALDGLRRTKAILHKAPVRKVPHNFTLRAADVQLVKAPRWLPTMQWSSAVAALVAVFLFAYQLVPGFPRALTATSQKAADNRPGAAELAAPQAALSASQATPAIIYWGGPPPPVGATGLGGGGGGGGGSGQPVDCSLAGAMCGGGAANSGIGGGGAATPTEMPFPQPPIPNTLPDLQARPTEAPRAAIAAEPVTGTGPILGIRPDAERGQTLPETSTANAAVIARGSVDARKPVDFMLIAAAGLLLLAIGLMVAAILIRRKILR